MRHSTINPTLFLKLMNFELLLITHISCCYFPHTRGGRKYQVSRVPTAKSRQTCITRKPTHLNSASCLGAKKMPFLFRRRGRKGEGG